MDNKSIILGGVIGAIAGIIAALALMLSVGLLGGNGPLAGGSGRAYNTDAGFKSLTLATSSAADSSNGTNDTITGLFEQTCNLAQSTAGSHAATTSKEYTCSVTGVRAGDTVIVMLPQGAGDYSSGAESLSGGFVVNSAFATTSDRIGVSILNMTGAATSSATQATTSAHVMVIR